MIVITKIYIEAESEPPEHLRREVVIKYSPRLRRKYIMPALETGDLEGTKQPKSNEYSPSCAITVRILTFTSPLYPTLTAKFKVKSKLISEQSPYAEFRGHYARFLIKFACCTDLYNMRLSATGEQGEKVRCLSYVNAKKIEYKGMHNGKSQRLHVSIPALANQCVYNPVVCDIEDASTP